MWLTLLTSLLFWQQVESPAKLEPVAPSRPNVVILLADDLGIGDPACYGTGSRIPTPNLDRVAREGLRFTDMHSPSSVCTPTRYGLLTGRYCWRTQLKRGVLGGASTNLIDPERVTLPDLLQQAGYRTAAVGKWHLGLGEGESLDWSAPLRPGPIDHGFDSFFGIPASLDMEPYVWVIDDGLRLPATERVEGSGHRRQGGGGFWRKGMGSRDFRHVEVLPRSAARAVELVERWAREDRERPFFLYLALSAPHTPWLPTEGFQGRTPAGHYGDFVAQVDGVVGQLLDALDRTQQDSNTWFFVTSDNGSHWPESDIQKYGHDANGGWRGQKADIHEGGHRVPFLVRGPGVPAGESRDDLACLTDLFATAAGIAGEAHPEGAGEDSFNLLPLMLDDENTSERRDCVHHAFDGMFALRMGDWKLIEGRGSGGFTGPKRLEPGEGEPSGQLYNLRSDPGETRNLWLEQPQRVEVMQGLLDQRRRMGHRR